jgi:hypothetical protein
LMMEEDKKEEVKKPEDKKEEKSKEKPWINKQCKKPIGF